MRHHICTRHPLRRAVLGRALVSALASVTLACTDPQVDRATGPIGAPSTPVPTPAPPLVAEIFLADADGTVRGRLTEGSWPSWSPDGRRIVFHRDLEVRIIDSDGANERQLAAGRWPTWSPDGGRIAFVANRALFLMNADGSSIRRLRDPTLYGSKFDDAGLLAWSPDGALIAFGIMSYELPPRVALVTADGASERYLTSPWDAATLGEDSPAWSPDGSRIAFTSIGRGLMTLDLRSGATTAVLAGGEFGSRPAWSPDGRLIAFNTQQAVPSIMTIAPSGGCRAC